MHGIQNIFTFSAGDHINSKTAHGADIKGNNNNDVLLGYVVIVLYTSYLDGLKTRKYFFPGISLRNYVQTVVSRRISHRPRFYLLIDNNHRLAKLGVSSYPIFYSFLL